MWFELKRLWARLFLGDAKCLCAVIGQPALDDEVTHPDLKLWLIIAGYEIKKPLRELCTIFAVCNEVCTLHYLL